MYLKDLKHRISLRIDEDTYNYICDYAKLLKMTPSRLIRSCLRNFKATTDLTALKEIASQNSIEIEQKS